MLIGRTVRVSRPSMRGSPSRIWLRTIFASRSKRRLLSRFSASAPAPAPAARLRPRRRDVLRGAACAPACWRSGRRRAARPRRARPTLAISASSLAGACQSQSGLPASSTSSLIALMAACICSWPNTTAPSMTSSASSLASDSTISTAASVPATTRLSCELVELGRGRVQHVLAVDVADARGADRAVERNAGKRQRGRGADQRRDVGIDLRIRPTSPWR